jgi:hypothetical protein
MTADASEMMKKERTKAAPNKTLNNNQPAKKKEDQLDAGYCASRLA